MLFFPLICGFTSTSLLFITCRLPPSPKVDDYREYLSVFFCLFWLPSIQTYIKENIELGGSGGVSGETHLQGKGFGGGPSSTS